jgi:hypothetical protein
MGRVREGEYGCCNFIYMYEDRTMKPVEIILRKGRGDTSNQDT